MGLKKGFRTASLTLTMAIGVLSFAVVAQAGRKTVTYSLASGTSSKAIIPVTDKPVLVIGAQTTAGNVGSSDMTVVNSKGDAALVWSGLESDGGGTTADFSSIAGTHIIFIDFGHCVDLEVHDATSFVVHNVCGSTQTGSVTLMW